MGFVVVAVVGACTAGASPTPEIGVGPSVAPGATVASSSASPGSSAATPTAEPSLTAGASATPAPTPAPTAKRSAATGRSLGTLPPPPPPPPGYLNLILYHTPVKGSLNGWFSLINSDGTGNRKLALGRYAHWNSNGSAIEVVNYGANCVPSLSVYPVNGGTPTSVSIAFAAGDGSFDWTPDGSRLSFFRSPNGYICNGMNSIAGRDLYSVKADGTGLTNFAPGLPRVEPTSWVPDGSAVVIARHAALNDVGPIQRINVATKSVTQILASGTYSAVNISPDGKLLAYVTKAGAQSRLHVTNNVGTGPSNVRYQNYDLGQAAAQDVYGLWGSDSGHLAVVRVQPDSQLGSGTYVEYYKYDPTEKTAMSGVYCGGLLTSVLQGTLDWAPDNSLFVSSTVGNFGTGQPYVAKILIGDTAGKGGIFLAGTEGNDWVAWQPYP